MIIGVGTKRAPKVRAVREVLDYVKERRPTFLTGEMRIETRKVPSGTPDMPRGTAETMEGARNRADNVLGLLRGEGVQPYLAIGLEGGVLQEGGDAFLESWAYVTNGEHGSFGSSGCVPLPAPLAHAVLREGRELGPEADRFFGKSEVAANEGTFGVLTALLVSRQEAFMRSLLHALAPFYNASAYTGELGRRST